MIRRLTLREEKCKKNNFVICWVCLDVSGGESPSILVAIRDCIKASNVLSFGKSEGYKPLSFKEAFFLATLGGSQGRFWLLAEQPF